MSKYKGIIFDLDGTLLDTIEDIGDSMNEVLEELGLPTFTYDEYYMKVGGGFMGLATNCLPEDSDEKVLEETAELFAKYYDENYLNKTKPYQGIDQILEKLKDKGIKLGVNSNKRDGYTKSLVEKHFKDTPFLKVIGDREGIDKKPNPISAMEIAGSMGLNPDEILYIGDSEVDISTAKNANMDSVGVSWGFRGKEKLKECDADFIVEKPKEILNLI